jgi:hypothetical protein
VIFSSNIIKTPKSSRDGAENKERKKKKKAAKVSSNKGEVKHFDRRKTLQLQKSFSM